MPRLQQGVAGQVRDKLVGMAGGWERRLHNKGSLICLDISFCGNTATVWWEVLQNDRPKQVVVPTPSAELQLGGVFCVKHLKSPVRFWMFVSRSFKRLRILEKYCRLPRIIANFPNTIRCWIPIQNGLEHFLKRVNHDKTQKHEDTELKP